MVRMINSMVYVIIAIAAVIGLSGYMYNSMRKIIKEIARYQGELATILEKMNKLVTLSDEEWVKECRDLITLINKSRERDSEFAYRHFELIALSYALSRYIESMSAAPEPVNRPVLQEFYRVVGNKLKSYVDAIKIGQRKKARLVVLELIGILSSPRDFIGRRAR